MTTTQTETITISENNTQPLLLRLAPPLTVTWDNEVIDNEHLNRRSSKACWIYHKKKKFDVSDTESESESDDSDDSTDDRPKRRRKKCKRPNCDNCKKKNVGKKEDKKMKDGSNKKTDEHAGLKSGNRRPGVEVDLFAANGGVKT